MSTLEMKTAISGVEGGRDTSTEIKDGNILEKFKIEEDTKKNKTTSILESELECRINPYLFEGEWLNHTPTTAIQKEILDLYLYARFKGRLHAFTCMTVDPTLRDGNLVYQKGRQVKKGVGFNKKILEDYNPGRHSRMMTRTEYVNRNLFLIQKLVEFGCGIDESWIMVCDDSKKLGHYSNSDNSKHNFELTGSRGICGFYDLANTCKLIAEDP